MNTSKARHFFRLPARVLALLAALLAVSGVHAANEQAGRFLLIFETSPAVKKSLPAIRQTLAALFSSNFQNEINSYDDLAVWTVDETLHTGTFPLANWTPEDAEMYNERLTDFLGHQKFTRHASLAAIQPLLNRVAKNSDRLTVLIFCDSQSQLSGTPYDAGVNEIITNATTRAKGSQTPFVLVLRSYHGQYLGCSVNHPGRLNFPAFPAPPKPAPAPAPVEKPAPASIAMPGTGPVATPIPALIIVGTNATTNAALPTKPAAPPPAVPPVVPASPPPVRVAPPALVSTTTNTIVPSVPPPVAPQPTVATAPPATAPPATAPPVNVAPVPTTPPPTLPTVVTTAAPVQTPAPEPAAVPSPAAVEPASTPSPVTSNPPAAAVEKAPAETGFSWPLLIGGASLVAAVGLVLWLVTRSRRPQGSLITSSMRDDPRLPPRK